MENLETNKNENSEEISLLDLVLVFIKYRKLILIGTLAVILLSVVKLYVFPMLKNTSLAGSVNITYTINEADMPLDLQNQVFDNANKKTPVTISSLAVETISSPSFIAEVNKKQPLFGGENIDIYSYNGFIQRAMGYSQFKVKASTVRNGFDISFVVPVKDIDLSQLFVNEILVQAGVKLESYIMPKVDAFELSAKKIVSEDSENQAELKALLVKTTAFKDNYSKFIYQSGEPFAVSIEKNTKKTLIIYIIAGFLLFVVIAFILNAINTIKKDPDASKLVSEAWKSGKFVKKSKGK